MVTLTSKFPFEGGVQLMDEDTDVPQELRETIRRCLEVVREQRFQDVADLKNALLPRRSFAIPSPSAPGVLITPRLRELWEFPIDTPNWRIWTTPVLDISGGCYLWGRQKLTRLDPDTGDVLWSWSPGERDRQSGIRSSPHSFAVHTDGQLIYVRQESLLSCLHASNGALQWEHALSSNVGGSLSSWTHTVPKAGGFLVRQPWTPRPAKWYGTKRSRTFTYLASPRPTQR